MQRNVFKESIYFNVYGTIIEVPYKNLENTHFKNYIGYHDVAKYSEWVIDYTGKIYKNRSDKIDHLKEFLNSGRNNTLEFTDYSEALKFSNQLVQSIANYSLMLSSKNLVTVPKDAVIKEYFLITHMRAL